MPKSRKQPEPQPIVIRQFTPMEIAQGVAKLRRRIDDVKALQDNQVSYSDQRRRTAQQNIRTMILEVFGEHSPQYSDHKHHEIWEGGIWMGMEDYELEARYRKGIPNTISMLEGLISWLEEKRTDTEFDTTSRIKAAFEELDLHPRIASVAADLYRDEHYRNAILDASIALVNLVREKSGRHDLDGALLMQTVFSVKNPILAFNDLTDQTDKDEQQGMMQLFTGAVLAFRNPRAHAIMVDTPEGALEYIGLLSFLAKCVDRATRRKTT